MGMINLELYKIFYIVASCKSITKAAKELYISQPAVSQSIKQLEQQIGGKLFSRNSKGMDLTYEGKIIYEHIRDAIVLVDTAERKFSQLQKLSFGEVKIGVSDTITRYYLLKYISVFVKQYPDASLKIANRTTQETLDLLKSSKVDLGFVNGPISDDYLNIQDCLSYRDVFIVNKDMAEKYCGKKSMSDISNMPLIMVENTSHGRQQLEQFFQEAQLELNPYMDLGSLDLIIDMVKAGLGVGCLPEFMVENDIANGELFKIELDFVMPEKKLQMVTLNKIPLNFLTNQFVSMIINNRG